MAAHIGACQIHVEHSKHLTLVDTALVDIALYVDGCGPLVWHSVLGLALIYDLRREVHRVCLVVRIACVASLLRVSWEVYICSTAE